MAINLDAIKAKLQAMQQTSGGGSKTSEFMWKPPVGKSQVRLVPYAFDKDNPFIEMYFHYEIAKRTMVSPVSFGRPDPIVEFAEKLKKSGDKDDWKLGKKIEPKFRVYAPVIVRGAEHEGVKFWSFGKQIYTELLSVITDPDYGDIVDLMNGRDVTVEHIAAEKEGGFPSFTVRVKPNTTPATTDKEIAEMIVGKQKAITELYQEPTYEEMTEVLAKWLDPSNEADAQGTKAAAPAKSITGATTATSADDISSAFDSLFNS
jgi:hypothetical protein